MDEAIMELLEERKDLAKRFLAATSHLTQEHQVYILVSWMDVSQLREMVEFQEAHQK